MSTILNGEGFRESSEMSKTTKKVACLLCGAQRPHATVVHRGGTLLNEPLRREESLFNPDGDLVSVTLFNNTRYFPSLTCGGTGDIFLRCICVY